MANIKGGGKFVKAMEGIVKSLSRANTVQVGFMEDAKYPDGTQVAMVAAIQNYGAPKVGIPPRPFFTNMIAEKSASWPAAIEANLKATNYDAERTLNLVGKGIAEQLQQSIRDTNTPPLKESTLKARGVAGVVFDPTDESTYGAKPLVRSGHMLNSVTSRIKRSTGE